MNVILVALLVVCATCQAAAQGDLENTVISIDGVSLRAHQTSITMTLVDGKPLFTLTLRQSVSISLPLMKVLASRMAQPANAKGFGTAVVTLFNSNGTPSEKRTYSDVSVTSIRVPELEGSAKGGGVSIGLATITLTARGMTSAPGVAVTLSQPSSQIVTGRIAIDGLNASSVARISSAELVPAAAGGADSLKKIDVDVCGPEAAEWRNWMMQGASPRGGSLFVLNSTSKLAHIGMTGVRPVAIADFTNSKGVSCARVTLAVNRAMLE